jgi:hypothetical protein
VRSPEASVVRSLKRHLIDGGLGGVAPAQILVDADPSYVGSRYASELEPMARVDVGGGRPDLLCSFDRTQGTVVSGFEVKAASRDWLQGLAQARRYRAGVHHSYLALPGRRAEIEYQSATMARESGVGVLVLEDEHWHELVRPADPTPLPWSLGSTSAALEGVPAARQLQLNHPLNYLIVPLLAATLTHGRSLEEELAVHWSDLGSPGTRRHAIVGAQSLRLVDVDLKPTAEGIAVADLLLGLGFTTANRPNKRTRLADVVPAVAAVARFVFLQQPAVRLILRVLATAGTPLPLPELAMIAFRLDPPLGGALFLDDPSREFRPDLTGTSYNSSTVFKLKQNLWHAGLLATGFHSSAGGRATDFRPAEDLWALERSALRMPQA